MNAKKHELTEIVVRLGIIVRGLSEAHRQGDLVRQGLVEEVNSLGVRCELLLKEIEEDRVRTEVLVRGLQNEVARLTEKYVKAEDRIAALSKGPGKYRERYSLVELERRALQHQLDQVSRPPSSTDLLETILDTQLCPHCGEEHLVSRCNDVFDCLYCKRAFRLAIDSRDFTDSDF